MPLNSSKPHWFCQGTDTAPAPTWVPEHTRQSSTPDSAIIVIPGDISPTSVFLLLTCRCGHNTSVKHFEIRWWKSHGTNSSVSLPRCLPDLCPACTDGLQQCVTNVSVLYYTTEQPAATSGSALFEFHPLSSQNVWALQVSRVIQGQFWFVKLISLILL